ncbi:MAG TPA: YkgJ family cysteine cluster protein [Candidatus Thermoplasmatota archaeon]|nr:YkgJ family cysteine cluster protein [Candidatus Thermoplasmatota archaeon]
MDASDAAGLTFRCIEGCGFCCTTAPGLLAGEERALPRALVERKPDGALGLRLEGAACAALDGARRCTVYEARPSTCRQFPVHLHALDEVQVTLHRGCPGLAASGGDEPASALVAAATARLTTGAETEARRARDNWREFRRRARISGLWDEPTALRAAVAGIVPGLWTGAGIERIYAAVEDGDLVAEDAVAAFEGATVETKAPALLADVAAETFEGELPQVVDPAGFRWLRAKWAAGRLALADARGPQQPAASFALHELPLWRFRDGAERACADAVVRLAGRDLALGAAARLVDVTGYQVTFASAFLRVVADQAAGIALRSALLTASAGKEASGREDASLAVAWQETAFLALPTVGAVL